VSQTPRFQETLRKLAIFHEELAETSPRLHLAQGSTLDARTIALLQVAVAVATGSSLACLQWSATRALAAGANHDEIVDVLLAIAPLAGLARIVTATPDLARALDYDIEAALEEPEDH